MRRFWTLIGAAALVVAALPASIAMAGAPDEAPPNDATTEGFDIEGPGRVRLHGAGTLEAKGWGRAHLAGDLSIEGSVFGGTLTVQDHDGDARFHVADFAERKVNPDGSITYVAPHGRFIVSGSGVEVTIRGAAMHFTARGRGVADLAGYGWFSANGGPRHTWPPL